MKLVNQVLEGRARDEAEQQALTLKRIQIDDPWVLADIELLAVGAYSPHHRFMLQGVYQLAIETPGLLPIVLPVDDISIYNGEQVALFQGDIPLAIVLVNDKYRRDKTKEARVIYRTEDTNHPGVAHMMQQPDWCIGGSLWLINFPQPHLFADCRLTPKQTQAEFARRGWQRSVAFQTRNPVHRAHEYIQKCALEMCDGLLLHPLVGETKEGDIPADIRMRTYEKLIEVAYPKDRVLLSVFPSAMRYAGPREAVHHAIVRRNYGCTHFIVGRDHAGVGNYYGPYDAQHIFDGLDLGITPLFFDNTFYCRQCGYVASEKTCPHSEQARLSLSGTQFRAALANGEDIPIEFSRPEIVEILRGICDVS